MTILCFDAPPLAVGILRLDAPTPAVSPSASSVEKKVAEAIQKLLGSSLGTGYRITRERIAAAAGEAYEDGWDGYGGRAVDRCAIEYADHLVRHLPVNTPAPDVTVDPDGEISLEWHRGPRQTFSISVSATGRLSYAGLFGESSVYGTEAYFTDGVPQEVRSGLRRVLSQTPR